MDVRIFFLNILVFYRPQRSWGKVIFSQASVILLTGGVPGPEGVLDPGGVSAPEGMPGWGVSGPQGACLLLGGCLVWGVPGLGGGHLLLGDLVETPPGTATAAGGMHPTGMHSCSVPKSNFKSTKVRIGTIFVCTSCAHKYFLSVCLNCCYAKFLVTEVILLPVLSSIYFFHRICPSLQHVSPSCRTCCTCTRGGLTRINVDNLSKSVLCIQWGERFRVRMTSPQYHLQIARHTLNNEGMHWVHTMGTHTDCLIYVCDMTEDGYNLDWESWSWVWFKLNLSNGWYWAWSGCVRNGYSMVEDRLSKHQDGYGWNREMCW